MSPASDARPLIAHVVYRFDVGGLENGVVNLINHLPKESYRHAVISLTGMTEFKRRVAHPDVQFHSLHKGPGHALRIYPALYRLFRTIRPAIVHTRNLAALEALVPAWAAGVPVRIHGEHGRDVGDLNGASRKHQWIRRLYSPFVTRYVALSRDLQRYLIDSVGVPGSRIVQIYNGVDTRCFSPAGQRQPIAGCPFDDPRLWVVGLVGRMETVKDPITLVNAFLRALDLDPRGRDRLRLVMVGEGPQRGRAMELLERGNAKTLAWLPGARPDVAAIFRGLDCFVLPSLAEGISNTILEAMATGLPVIATDVGGNAELVEANRTGFLVSPADPEVMARAIVEYAQTPASARTAGAAGRIRAEQLFSLGSMVDRYGALYREQLGFAGARVPRMSAV